MKKNYFYLLICLLLFVSCGDKTEITPTTLPETTNDFLHLVSNQITIGEYTITADSVVFDESLCIPVQTRSIFDIKPVKLSITITDENPRWAGKTKKEIHAFLNKFIKMRLSSLKEISSSINDDGVLLLHYRIPFPVTSSVPATITREITNKNNNFYSTAQAICLVKGPRERNFFVVRINGRIVTDVRSLSMTFFEEYKKANPRHRQ